MNLRDLARGQDCQVRIPGVCDGGGETTVLAHYRMAGDGLGMKPPDERGSWCCGPCHDVVDFRVKYPWSRAQIKLAHLEGVVRTQEKVRKL